MKRVVVTGVAGFIGSNFARMVLQDRPEWFVVGVDSLTYAGNLESIADLLEDARFQFVRADICDADAVGKLFAESIDYLVNFAAESHVDRSILGGQAFVQTNVMGVQVLLDLARTHKLERFLQVSTDEVYGSLGPEGAFVEDTPLAPSSPYSATKASADLLVDAYRKTFGVPTLITRCSNNYGPFQFPEKLIPLFTSNLIEGRKVPLYGDGLNVRDWIHVLDHCEAILTVLEKGEVGRVYNIGGEAELPNIEIARRILKQLGHDDSMIEYVGDRLGHDRRYAMDITRIRDELGWSPRHTFERGLAETIDWYVSHDEWWRRIKSGAYRTYYEEQYGRRGVVG